MSDNEPPPTNLCWSRTASDEFEDPRSQNLRPSWAQMKHVIPLASRYFFRHFLVKALHGQKPPIDQIRMRTSKACYGVPCGGIGSGSIGRGFRGEFTRFHMVPGIYSYDTVWADAFHVIIKDPDTKEILFKSVLCSSKTKTNKEKKELFSWDYAIQDECISYRALYPRSWYIFKIPKLNLTLHCQQVSPFLPHDYEQSCLPASVFEWTVKNESDKTYEISIAFTFKNGWGSKKQDPKLKPKTKHFSSKEFPNLVGKQIEQTFRESRLTYAIGCKRPKKENDERVVVMNDFNPDSDGRTFWSELDKLDEVPNSSEESISSQNVAVGVASTKKIGSHVEATLEVFALCWDMPLVKFSKGRKAWTRYYTKYYTKTSSSDGESQEDVTAQNILEISLERYQDWKMEIQKWQRPVQNDPDLPDWFKSALFNEMYFIADGGSQWLIFDHEDPDDPLKNPPDSAHLNSENDPRKLYGRFGYLESHEYRLYNTYDVHFYASFALLALFPGLQLSLQTDFCEATRMSDRRTFREMYKGKKVELCPEFSVPHDLGDPEDDPFFNVNGYRILDVSNWKDLPLKMIVSIWRDIKKCEGVYGKFVDSRAVEDLKKRSWIIFTKLFEKIHVWDKDGDGLIENEGLPDQTYDSWKMTGASSYCNSLWITALICLTDFANDMNEAELKTKYEDLLVKAKVAFFDKLWLNEERFFRYDQSPRGGSVVMSDQLCGFWYLSLMEGISQRLKDVVDDERISLALNTIYELNVKQFCDGTSGAVNGFLYKEKSIDRSSIQSEEMWTGTTYGLASFMIAKGLVKEGFLTAEGVYKTVYDKIGLGFETPEALYEKKCYRSLGYMRPLSIWSMYEAWKSSDHVES